jgi:hypothetical protein
MEGLLVIRAESLSRKIADQNWLAGFRSQNKSSLGMPGEFP